jgi:hypothetical protein
MNHGLSDQVRAVALEKYIHPAVRAGKERFSVAVRDLMQDLQAEGFPPRNWPQICTAIQAEKFLRTNGLEIEAVDGPPKKQSPTVIVRYRIANPQLHSSLMGLSPPARETIPVEEAPEEWAHRMTGKLFGLMKDEIASLGGAEAFIRWVRSEDEDEAA